MTAATSERHRPGEAVSIAPVCTLADLAAAKLLFQDYAASLDIDLGYQDFAGELATLPGRYAPPSGTLLLARGADGTPAGCVGLRAMDRPGRCEMKRLYVAPWARGLGCGRRLTEALIGQAERMGYEEIWLDTLPAMRAAQGLYEAAGFEPVAPYYDSPIPGTAFLRLRLGSRRGRAGGSA